MDLPALQQIPLSLKVPDGTGALQHMANRSGTTGAAQSNEELKQASQQFEAVFLRQFIGEAMKPLLHPTPGSDGPGAQIYQYMITDAIANNLAQHELFGLSSLLQMQLARPEAENADAKTF